jgi:hypothetical protein
MNLPNFCSRLVVEVSGMEGLFILDEPLIYYSAFLGREIRVPKGFPTDFASIPRLLQNIIQVNGKHRPAAVVHDYLCALVDHDLSWTVPGMPELTQGMADKVFREAMKCLDVEFVESSVMYRMVRGYQKTKAWLKGETY